MKAQTAPLNEREISMEKLPGRVYYVECPVDPSVLLAIDTQIKGDYVRWFDTVKERMMKIAQVLENEPTKFAFQREDSPEQGLYSFTPLNLEIYNRAVKPHLANGQDFADDESMLKAIEESKDNSW